MTKDLARCLNETGIQEISISLDGLEEFHNTIRGVENSSYKAWNALELPHQYAPRVELVVNSILTPYNLDSLRGLRKKILETFPDISSKYLPLTQHELFLNSDQKSFVPENRESATFEQIKVFIEEAISDSKVVNSTIFLQKTLPYFAGQNNILEEQKNVFILIFHPD